MSVIPLTQPLQAARRKRRQVRTALGSLALGAAIAALLLALTAPPSHAEAARCADVEVIFARGTFEPAGIGRVGQAFVDALEARLKGQTVDVYAVNYPASLDFGRAADGIIDASNHLRDTAVGCPKTRVILGGYSQGAAISAYVTTDALPIGYAPPDGITGPLPVELAQHVAAVALFGKPSTQILHLAQPDAPPLAIGAAYVANSIDLCAPADPICEAGSLDRSAHSLYTLNGMTDQAAEFSAQRL